MGACLREPQIAFHTEGEGYSGKSSFESNYSSFHLHINDIFFLLYLLVFSMEWLFIKDAFSCYFSSFPNPPHIFPSSPSHQFIGPTAPVMAALGDKVSANILAQTAEVPSIPWSGGGIKAELNDEGVIPKEIFDSACVFDVEGAVATAEKIGYPVMIKASEGGGGKGIRMANNLEELRSGFVQVQLLF